VNTLYKNWSGQPQWSQDSFSAPVTNEGHTETSAVSFNGLWWLYHRHRGYQGDPNRTTIGVSTSLDGTNFTFVGDVIRPNDNGVGCLSVNAPKVLVQPGLLTMVYEAVPGTNTPGCPTPAYQTTVAMASSTDGLLWFDQRIVLVAKQPWEGSTISAGRQVGNVGTPYIHKAGNHIYIGYHGFSGSTSPPYLQRGVARFNGSDPRQITAVNASYNNNLVRSKSPITFLRQNGSPENRPVFSAGYGAADIIRYIPGSPGTDDGGFYMVLEGYQGSPFCNDPNTFMVIAMARADIPEGPYRIQDKVLLGSFQSPGNPPSSCGRDLPSWQYHNGQYKVILTQPSKFGLQRIALLD
jgi:hypothetical protein